MKSMTKDEGRNVGRRVNSWCVMPLAEEIFE